MRVERFLKLFDGKDFHGLLNNGNISHEDVNGILQEVLTKYLCEMNNRETRECMKRDIFQSLQHLDLRHIEDRTMPMDMDEMIAFDLHFDNNKIFHVTVNR